MDRQQFEQKLGTLVAEHGELVGRSVKDPTVKVTVRGETTEQPNPTPTYRYTFTDGTYIEAKGSGGAGSQADNFEVYQGTALKPGADAGAKTISTADGRTMQWDPETNRYDIEIGAKSPAVSASTGDQFILTRQPDGSLKQEENPNYRAPTPPQGPAFSSTAAGVEQAHQNRMDEITATADAQAKAAIDQEKQLVAMGLKELPAAVRDAQAKIDRIKADEKYQQDMAIQKYTSAAAMERQTQQQGYEQRQAQAGLYSKQAEEGMATIDKGMPLGTPISALAMKGMVFDPRARALALLGQAMTGPDFDPQTRALELIGRQQAPAPSVAGMAPPAPSAYTNAPPAPSVDGAPPAPSVAGFLPRRAPTIR